MSSADRNPVRRWVQKARQVTAARVGLAQERADDGIALMMVLLVMLVSTAVALVTLAIVLNGITVSAKDRYSKSAIAAAQAGVEEYISRLNNSSPQYWLNNGVDPANPAMDPNPATPRCESSRTIPGSSSQASYCYRVLTPKSQIAARGTLDLQVTATSANGSSPTQRYSRTITATLAVETFAQYSFFADLNLRDPALGTRPSDGVTCGYYRWIRPATCDTNYQVRWTTGESLTGKVHMNDPWPLLGTVGFYGGPVTTGSVAPQPTYYGGGSPTGLTPTRAPLVALPTGTGDVLKYTLPKVDADPNTDRPGCLYRGNTRIIFNGSTYTVESPNSTGLPAFCSTGPTDPKPIPPLIYVTATTGTCTAVSNFPRAGELTTGAARLDYTACRGTALVQGTVQGKAVTVYANDDAIVAGNIIVPDKTGSDVVGVVANNFVYLYHPVNTSNVNILASNYLTQIDASLMSLQHSVVVQNYDRGAKLSPITFTGGTIMKWLSVSEGATSGAKFNFAYDSRLSYLSPPYFPQPAVGAWSATQYSDDTVG